MKDLVIEEFKQTLEVMTNIIKPELEGYFSKIRKPGDILKKRKNTDLHCG